MVEKTVVKIVPEENARREFGPRHGGGAARRGRTDNGWHPIDIWEVSLILAQVIDLLILMAGARICEVEAGGGPGGRAGAGAGLDQT